MQDCNLGDNAFVTTLTAVMERDRAASLVVLEVITITVDRAGVIPSTILGFDTTDVGFWALIPLKWAFPSTEPSLSIGFWSIW